jgi:hypothetical protein
MIVESVHASIVAKLPLDIYFFQEFPLEYISRG